MDKLKRTDNIVENAGEHMGVLSKHKHKSYPNTKIVVTKVNGKVVNEVFDLYKVWNHVLQEKEQKTLF